MTPMPNQEALHKIYPTIAIVLLILFLGAVNQIPTQERNQPLVSGSSLAIINIPFQKVKMT